VSVVKSGAGGRTTDFSPGYYDALTRAQKAKDTGKQKALQVLDNLIQDLEKDDSEGGFVGDNLDGRDGLLCCNKLEIFEVYLKALDRPELKHLHRELNSIKEMALSVADLATKGAKKARKGAQREWG